MKVHLPSPRAFVYAALLVLIALATGAITTPSSASPAFIVTKTTDTADGTCDSDCSLREAVIASNATPGPDSISLPAGNYVLSIGGRGEDSAAMGDLDLTDDVTMSGDGDESAILGCEPVDGYCRGIDRVFQVHPAVVASISDLTVMLGDTSDCSTCQQSAPGAGIYNLGSLNLTRVLLTKNSGGGLGNGGAATITDSRFVNNSSYHGAAINNTGTASLDDSLLDDNWGGGFSAHGGAIHNDGPLSITASTVRNNRSGFLGGGLYSSVSVTVEGSTFVHNSNGGGGYGGAIAGSGGVLSIEHSFFSGGGVQWSTEMHIRNSSFFRSEIMRGFPLAPNNDSVPTGTITNASVDGPISNVAPGVLALTNVSADLLRNYQASGGKIVQSADSPGQIELRNTILTGAIGEVNCDGPVISLGNNIETGEGCDLSQSGDSENTDPMVGPWSDYGGPFWTVGLLPGSPAIDTGDDDHCPSEDIRGVTRPQDGDESGTATCDIGSYEFCAGEARDGVYRDACGTPPLQQHGAMFRANVTAGGAEATCEIIADVRECGRSPKLTADGEAVAFQSSAGNLVAGDLTGCHTFNLPDTNCLDVFVKDLVTGAIEVVSVNESGERMVGDSTLSAISRDGRYVLFTSEAPLTADDADTYRDAFVRDRQLGATELVSVERVDDYQSDHYGVSVTDDGRYASFSSFDGSAVRDLQTDTTFIVSIDTLGAEVPESSAPLLSADGSLAAFWSNLPLVPEDTNSRQDVYVRDLVAGTTERVSLASDGSQGAGDTSGLAFSADGRYVVMSSSAQLTPQGLGFGVFLRDRQRDSTERLDLTPGNVGGDGGSLIGRQAALGAGISDDGRFVTFTSDHNNLLLDEDNNLAGDVFIRDRSLNLTSLVSRNASGVQGNHVSGAAAMDASGRIIAFESLATNLIEGDTNGAWDIFVADLGDPPPPATATPIPTSPSATAPVTATPVPTPSHAPTATPTSQPSDELVQGDILCTDGNVAEDDLLFVLGYVGELHNGVTAGDCPDLGDIVASGSDVAHAWGDVNCDGSVDEIDALFIVTHMAGVALIPDDPHCLPIGQDSV